MSNGMISLPRDKLEAMAFGRMEFDEFSQYMNELQALLGQTAAQHQGEPVSSTSDKYKAELYDEVWQLARDMGFGNVTDALMKLKKLKKQPAPVAVVLPSTDDLRSIIRKAARDADLMPGANYYTAAELAAEDVVSEVARLNPPQQ